MKRSRLVPPLSDDAATQLLLGNKEPKQQQPMTLDTSEEQESDLSPELETAYQLFTHGTKTARDVGQYMGIGKDKANNLLNELQEMGYIQR